jgi:hypothetical protein
MKPSAVVAIGVDRGAVSGDDGARWRLLGVDPRRDVV